MSNLPYLLVHYKFSIDDHPLTVIAADGVPIASLTDVHQLPIGIGQRVRGCLPVHPMTQLTAIPVRRYR